MVVITESKREWAFEIWTNAFDKYAIDLSEAGRPFCSRWADAPSGLSDELIVAADIIFAISCSLTEKSSHVFAEKVRGLVFSRRENEFFINLSELEVPALLASRVSPIAFEPVVPRGGDTAAKPQSSDYSIKLPSGEIFIEATTCDFSKIPMDTEELLKRIKRKLDDKRRQAARDRVYLLALKILGPQELLDLVRQLVIDRIWPNPQFRRYGGIIGFGETPGAHGTFQGVWLPNGRSVVPPTFDVTELLSGHRCYHLKRVNSVSYSVEEISLLRRRVAAPRTTEQSLAVPVRLSGGPLDGIEILLKASQFGDSQVTYAWDLKAKAKNEKVELSMPPHGPVEIAYARREDTLYEFAGYKLWIDEVRPSGSARDQYLLQLNMSN